MFLWLAAFDSSTFLAHRWDPMPSPHLTLFDSYCGFRLPFLLRLSKRV
jgi:hypothetical protein